jgi:hypothetical protein
MLLLHSILNLVALLLWVNWRGMGFKEYVPYRSTLIHTLRTAEPEPQRRWGYLLGLAGLLFFRGLLYQMVGPGLKWVPAIDLGVITLPFRSDQPWRMILFSLLSFVVLWVAFQICLLLLSVINRSLPDAQPIQHLVRLHLGRIERWPIAVKLLLPLLSGLLWLPIHPLLAAMGLLPAGSSLELIAEQSIVLGLASLLAWKYLLLGILVVHVVNSYVYFGRFQLLDFASDTARNVLSILRGVPLQLGRIDLAPFLMGGLVWLVAWGFEIGLVALFRKLPL